jgi:hypothetical protein
MKALDSAQQLCRTLFDKPKPIEQPTPKRTRKKLRQPWTPPPEWRAMFRAQATHDTIDDVTAYTGSHASWLEYETGRRRPGTVEDMVHDALADTFAGVVTWKPERCTLAMHLKSAIRTRLSHEIDRADHYKHVRMQDMSDSAATAVIALDAAPSTTGHKNRFAEEFTAKLRELAAGDEPVLQLVECYLAGIVERRKVCRSTGMTTTTFHNADRRLHRMVEKLPEELRTAALAGMSRDEP